MSTGSARYGIVSDGHERQMNVTGIGRGQRIGRAGDSKHEAAIEELYRCSDVTVAIE